MKLELLLVALAATALFSLGDILAAAWGKTGRWWWFVAMLIAGNLAWVLFAYLNKSWPLAVVGALVNTGLVVGSTLAGWLIFGERLQPLEKIALALAIVSMLLFTYARMNDPNPDAEIAILEEVQL